MAGIGSDFIIHFDKTLAITDKDANFMGMEMLTGLDPYQISILISGCHTVTGYIDTKCCPMRYGGSGYRDIFEMIIVQNASISCRGF